MQVLRFIDAVLDRVTMYRLTLYVLTALVVVAIGEAMFGILHYSAFGILLSATLSVTVCWITNSIGAKITRAATSIESVYITAFILTLIMPPSAAAAGAAAISIAAFAAMASKYILVVAKKHLFNPAALGAYVAGLTVGGYASWWVGGTIPMLPFVLVGGLLMVRKIRRFDLALSGIIAATVMMVVTTPSADLLRVLTLALVHTPLLFFVFVMLTEPTTTPPKRMHRIIYGVLVGILFAPALHIGTVYSTPELALLIGNVFAFFVIPKGRHILTLKAKEETSAVTGDFVFTPDKPFPFEAGQFLEWTIPHKPSDDRGTRRFFTIASSPTEEGIRLGVKFYGEPSTFKQALDRIKVGETISASNLAGEFTLPHDKSIKLVFIAGGIGITPFRSHFKYLLDTNDNRDIVLLYGNRTPADITYQPILTQAQERFGAKIVHVISDGAAPDMRSGIIDASAITTEVPDYASRTFYISGPQAMVSGVKSTLLKLGVARRNIHTDYFVGLA